MAVVRIIKKILIVSDVPRSSLKAFLSKHGDPTTVFDFKSLMDEWPSRQKSKFCKTDTNNLSDESQILSSQASLAANEIKSTALTTYAGMVIVTSRAHDAFGIVQDPNLWSKRIMLTGTPKVPSKYKPKTTTIEAESKTKKRGPRRSTKKHHDYDIELENTWQLLRDLVKIGPTGIKEAVKTRLDSQSSRLLDILRRESTDGEGNIGEVPVSLVRLFTMAGRYYKFPSVVYLQRWVCRYIVRLEDLKYAVKCDGMHYLPAVNTLQTTG